MPRWMPHVQSNQAPPDDLCQHLRKLHLTQVVEAAPDAEAGDPRHSILGASMGEGGLSRKLDFTPAAWLSCLSTSDGGMAFTKGEWQNWFCSFLGEPFRAHNLIQNRLVSIVRDAGFSATTRVATIEVQDQHIRADIYIPQMHVDGCRGLCIDASRFHDFLGCAANPSQNGTLRHLDIHLVLSSGHKRRLTKIEWHLASFGHQSRAGTREG